MDGYFNRFLDINLKEKDISEFYLTEKILKKYLGGSGIGTYLLAQNIAGNTDINNYPLIFSTGPFCGTKVPSSDRLHVTSISPLTCILAESDVGGKIGSTLRSCGYDGIILRGKAEKLSYLVVREDKIEIKLCPELKNRNTYQTSDFFKEKYNSKFTIMSIGQAGENGVKFASIMVGGREARAFGRSGLGTVMGNKNIKSVVVFKGTKQVPISNRKVLENDIKKSIPQVLKGTEAIKNLGTACGVNHALKTGDYPVKNWRIRNWEKEGKSLSGIRLNEKYVEKSYYCGQCIIGCGREININSINEAGPEYETIGTLGSNLLINDLATVIKANSLCNKGGIDTITTGNVIGLALELAEKGYLENRLLVWGNGENILEIIKLIIKRKGIGKLLAEGTRYINKKFDLPPELNIHIKGLEPPAHDPRTYASLYLGYATSNRGACHVQGLTHALEGATVFPEIGYKNTFDRIGLEGKALMTVKMQNIMTLFDSLKICKFLIYSKLPFEKFLDWYNLITGYEIDWNSFYKTGERIFNLKRMINVFFGVDKKQDRIPQRFYENSQQPVTESDFYESLQKYYKIRGWDNNGIPGNELLKELEIEEEKLTGSDIKCNKK